MNSKHLSFPARAGLLACMMLALIAASLAPPLDGARAATFTVTKTADTNDGTCDGDCSLREAINAANAAPGADTVMVPAGAYTLARAGNDEDAGDTGDLDVTEELTVVGAGAATTIVDGNDLDRVFHAAFGVDLRLEDLTVRNGSAMTGTGLNLMGGGILSLSGALTLDGVTVTQNRSLGLGGGVVASPLLMDGSSVTQNESDQGAGIVSSDLTMTDSHVDSNTGTDQGSGIWACCGTASFSVTGSTVNGNTGADQGAGIFFCCGKLTLTLTNSDVIGNDGQDQGGGIFFCCGSDEPNQPSNITIIGSRVNDNMSTDQGGGLFVCCDGRSGTSPTNVLIDDSEFSGNSTTDEGGGIYICCSDGEVTITDTVISGNAADIDDGGGAYIQSGTVTLARLTVDGNSIEDGDGAGLYIDAPSATLADSTLSNNRINDPFEEDGVGGGLYNNGTLSVVNTTISGNTAPGNDEDGSGGGAFNNGALSLLHVTITLNDGDEGGGIGGDTADVSVRSSIIAGNGGGDCFEPVSSAGHNIDGGMTCGLAGTGDLSSTNPLLAPLGDNGGPTLTHGLLAGSPALDAADPAECPDADQRGVARPIGANCDIGAFEGTVGSAAPTATSTAVPSDTPEPTNTAPAPTATLTSPGGGGGGGLSGGPDFVPTVAPSATASAPTQLASPTVVSGVLASEQRPIVAPDAGTGVGNEGQPASAAIVIAAIIGALALAGGAATLRRG
jgi:CSLREA domain-containing protein